MINVLIYIATRVATSHNDWIQFWLSGNEYPDSGVGSEPEGRCDGRNEEGDNDSDTESPPPVSHMPFMSDDNGKINGDYTVSF